MKTLLIAALLLVGCAHNSTIAPPSGDERSVNIDQRLLTECVPLTDMKDNPKPTEVLEQHGDDVAKFKACADGKKALIDAINQAFPKKE